METLPARIFVVDDEPLSREVLMRRLAAAGYASMGFADAATSLAETEKQAPNLMLLDVNMPGMSGLELLRVIRKQWSKQQLPVILVTALMDSEDVVAGLVAGANDYVVKPVNMPVLKARMEVCLDIGRAVRQRMEAEAALQAANNWLEQRVSMRTRELAYANQQLIAEIAEHKEAKDKLIAYQHVLRTLASKLAMAEEDERRRIAAGLHDDVGQLLALLKMNLGAPGVSVEEQRGIVDQAIRIVRSLSFELGSLIIGQLGFETALESMATEVGKRHAFAIQFTDDDHPKPLAPPIQVIVFRAVRELLHNIVKHAKAKTVAIDVRRSGDQLTVRVSDDGVGFVPPAAGFFPTASGGYGLFNVFDRLSYIGGNAAIESEVGRGTEITLTIPVTLEMR